MLCPSTPLTRPRGSGRAQNSEVGWSRAILMLIHDSTTDARTRASSLHSSSSSHATAADSAKRERSGSASQAPAVSDRQQSATNNKHL